MKKVHFDNMRDKKMIAILIISVICLLVTFFVEFENSEMNRYFRIIGFTSLAFYSSKMFWYKNHVQWNEKGMNIRIKSFAGKSIRFVDVKETKLEDKVLTIIEKDKNKIKIDVSEIELDDANKLNEIIRSHCFV